MSHSFEEGAPALACKQTGCTKGVKAKGYCPSHHNRLLRGAEMSPPLRGTPEYLPYRFWRKVSKGPSCWIWEGGRDTSGYGQFRYGGLHRRAHRVAYELSIGPIPEGLALDHLCRVRACVNPSHLEPVTHAENTRRGWEAAIPVDACLRGHVFDEANTYLREGRRGCRECRKARSKAWYQSQKTQKPVPVAPETWGSDWQDDERRAKREVDR